MWRSDDDRTILIVDDNVTNLKIAVEHLRASCAHILTARTGETAIERACLAHPDLILLDVQMPGIDGFETCRRLKADSSTRAIPVIFTSVLTGIEDKLSGFEVGGVDYISKPFQAEEMLARVNTHLTLYKLQRDLQIEVADRRRAEMALRKANLELQRLAVLDELTQVANRRRLDEYLRQQCEREPRGPLSLLLCDIDYFKHYNDGYGHPAGDDCLRRVAQSISQALRRPDDLVARYGGEEFAVILPDTDLVGAERVATVIQHGISQLSIKHDFSPGDSWLTMSIGAACTLPDSRMEPSALLAAADATLYAAKRSGRNRVAIERSVG